METTTQKNPLSVAKLVRLLVSQSTNAEERQHAFLTLSALLTSPNDILFCETIPDDHLFKTEACIVRDAFESATNGMHDRECFERLNLIQESSLFYSWRLVIEGILYFYAGDFKSMQGALAPLDSKMKVSILASELLALESFVKRGTQSTALSSLIFPKDGGLFDLAEQLEEAAKEGVVSFFIQNSAKLLKELKNRSLKDAESFALYAIELSDRYEIASEELVHTIGKSLGLASAYRLTAMYLDSQNVELAVLFWLKCILETLSSGDPDLYELIALCLCLESSTEKTAFFSLFEESPKDLAFACINLYKEVYDVLIILYPALVKNVQADFTKPREFIKNLICALSKHDSVVRTSPKKRIKKQLELFEGRL